MKATLEFDLPEDDEAFHTASNGFKFLGALQALRDAFRSKAKYEEDAITWEEAKDLFWDTVRHEGVELD